MIGPVISSEFPSKLGRWGGVWQARSYLVEPNGTRVRVHCSCTDCLGEISCEYNLRVLGYGHVEVAAEVVVLTPS